MNSNTFLVLLTWTKTTTKWRSRWSSSLRDPLTPKWELVLAPRRHTRVCRLTPRTRLFHTHQARYSNWVKKIISYFSHYPPGNSGIQITSSKCWMSSPQINMTSKSKKWKSISWDLRKSSRWVNKEALKCSRKWVSHWMSQIMLRKTLLHSYREI
jgi:hypothetical protein